MRLSSDPRAAETITRILIVAFFLFVSVAQAQTHEVSGLAADSLQRAINSGTMLSALDAWHESEHYKGKEKAAIYQKSRSVTLKREKSDLGRPLSYEILSIDQPIQESAIIYCVVKCEKSAVFIKLIYYNSDGKWDLKNYKTCMNPTHIIPDSLYRGSSTQTEAAHAHPDSQ